MQQLKNKIQKNNPNYSIIHVNIRSASRNFNQLLDLVNSRNPSVIVTSEVWRPQNSLIINNYHPPLIVTRNMKRGGGLALWTRLDVQSSSLNLPLNLTSIETISTLIHVKNKKPITIIGLYRPPQSNFQTSIKELESIFKYVADNSHQAIICGDLNIDINKTSKQSNDYLAILAKYQLIQHIKSPTRVTSKSSTIIDHIITKNLQVEASVLKEQVADHLATEATWDQKPNKNHLNQSKEVIDLNCTMQNINNIDWHSWIDKHANNTHIDNLFNDFHQIVTSCINKKAITINRRSTPIMPWFNNALLQARGLTLKARKKFLKSRTPENESNFKKQQKSYNTDLRKAKMSYYHEKIKAANHDPKKVWNIINEVTNRKIKQNADQDLKMIFNTKETTNSLEISNSFNNMFKNAAIELAKSIPKPKNDFTYFLQKEKKCTNTFKFSPVTESDVTKIVSTFKSKKSTGFDGISNYTLKQIMPTIITPLVFIINKSLQNGHFPSTLKQAKLTPLHKNGPKNFPGNYRPISQLSPFSKVIEKVVIKQLTLHSDDNQILSPSQFGFRSGHATEHAIITTRAHIESTLRKGKYCLLILIDLSKAFDTISSTEILPTKLKHYGLDDNSIKWFKSFFSNRAQTTTWQGQQSSIVNLHDISVVQGSSLGPNSFNFYLNDITSTIKSKAMLYADDTSIVVEAQDLHELESKANEELQTIDNFMSANKLSINAKKTVYLIFTPKSKKHHSINLYIANQKLEEVPEAKFLGIHIDNKLTFSSHFKHIMSKLRSAYGILCQTKRILTYKCKKMIYDSLFQSHLDYCNVGWMDRLNQKQINLLQSAQKKAIRALFNCKYNTPTQNMFSISGITKVNDLYQSKAIQFMWKTNQNQQPTAVQQLFPSQNTNNLRSSNMNKYPVSQYLKGDTIYNVIHEWNNTEQKIRDATSLGLCKFFIQQWQNMNNTSTSKPSHMPEVDPCYLVNYMRH